MMQRCTVLEKARTFFWPTKYLRITVVQAFGNGGMLPYAALRQTAVHAVPSGQHLPGAFQQHFSIGSEDALCLTHFHNGNDAFVGGSAPVGTGAVAAVMAHIHRLVASGSLGILNGEEFVGIQVVACPGTVFLQGFYSNGGLLILGQRRKGRQAQE